VFICNGRNEEQPNIICLVLHLPRMHRVVFNPNDDVVNVFLKAKYERTMLIGFFARCVIDANVRQYTYLQFLHYYVWKTTIKEWTPKQIGFALGRLYFVDPTVGE